MIRFVRNNPDGVAIIGIIFLVLLACALLAVNLYAVNAHDRVMQRIEVSE